MTSLFTLVGLAASTLVSEDLASIGAGLLVRAGAVSLSEAAAACVAGVYLGDLGLWWAGRTCGRRLLAVPWMARRLAAIDPAALADRLDGQLAAVVLVSRLVPGTRLPIYVAAGACGRRPLAFAVWSLLAVLVWTPLLVAAATYLGASVVEPLLRGLEAGLAGILLGAGVLFAGMRLASRTTSLAVRNGLRKAGWRDRPLARLRPETG